ncbi:DMT family transporter [Salinarimonas ramus]|uniref:DMT family transporter n=1 Tax=Salinarimonas ramus TaxID=690164 RepID=UPI001667D310|nr:DMT family transporter [Salinarimonas ramus]
MDLEFVGAGAGLIASFCWALASLFSTKVVMRLGTLRFSLFRVSFGALILAPIAISFGEVRTMGREMFLLIAASSIVGIVVGEVCLYAALRRLGPHLTLVLFSLNIPWTFVGEKVLSAQSIMPLEAAAVACSCVGLMVCVACRTHQSTEQPANGFRAGLAFGTIASVCHAVGLHLLAGALTTATDPLVASALRAGIAALVLGIVIGAVRGREVLSFRPIVSEKGIGRPFLLSAFLSSAAGLLFATTSVALASPAVAAASTSLSPLLVLPLLTLVRHEAISSGAYIGGGLSVGGLVALAALR